MASRFIVRYLPSAQDDLMGIYHWIAHDSPFRASAFLDRLDAVIGGLAKHPYLGRIPKHPELRKAGYRALTIASYLVFYVVRENAVEIHRAIHGSRNLDEIV